ncbi:MAG TPA: hypothetical protein PKN33_03820 [Phycisphaerae bacterium]|nr:hypothetical protein [Phycisphaerae bacterium]
MPGMLINYTRNDAAKAFFGHVDPTGKLDSPKCESNKTRKEENAKRGSEESRLARRNNDAAS